MYFTGLFNECCHLQLKRSRYVTFFAGSIELPLQEQALSA